MSLRLLLVAALIYCASTAVHAEAIEDQAEETNETVVESDVQPESIHRVQSLAVHMGLTPSEVVFGRPRNFRSESLNNFQLDPITEADEQ